jgi:hypothetical protein
MVDVMFDFEKACGSGYTKDYHAPLALPGCP